MSFSEILNHVKQIICALFALILPALGIGTVEDYGSKANTAEDVTRIMSFNVRNGEHDRGKNVPQSIADYLPDSVGLQECEGTWYMTLSAHLKDRYDIVGVGRLTGIKCIGEATAIMYRKDKYNLIDSGTFWLSETPDKVSIGWDAQHHRTCTWVILENKATGERYVHLNTHLDHKGELARTNGLALVLEKAESFDLPVVVTGDFNFKKTEQLYTQLISGNLTDTQDAAEKTMSGKTYHAYDGGEDGEPIDFICVNEKITSVKEYRIVRDIYGGTYLSDHYPIFADIIM
ncbi:MAG: endonuclease/exonuclease/phosphatase family protein [Clostridia bacterium]|nr:endonuclease/exonuclease/phosphatase family protein [Clostridia bacterium]